MEPKRRGSQKHLLDLLDDPAYEQVLEGLLHASGVTTRRGEDRRPRGNSDAKESTLRAFIRKSCAGVAFDFSKFDAWWVSDKYRNPQWDLLSTCRIDGESGLLMVEAKAHETEVATNGKSLGTDASDQSKENHDHIGRCIDEINRDLSQQLGSAAISRDTHYQLSNRVACAWKLAQCGLPVALLYLGFTGDTYFSDPLAHDEHWRRVMTTYMKGVLPAAFHERIHAVPNGASMRMLIRSLPVTSVSI